MTRISIVVALCLAVMACSAQPEVGEARQRAVPGGLPVDFNGSWQRNYARDDTPNAALGRAYDQLVRVRTDPALQRPGVVVQPSSKDTEALIALARLAELITRPDVLTIVQDDYEIRVDRKDDYSLLCAFFNGRTKAAESPFGTEVCGWDGNDLVSYLRLPGGLEITHRFSRAADGRQLRVITTLASRASPVPLSIRRFYTKFEWPAPAFNCIETLSMKRVCSTGELEL